MEDSFRVRVDKIFGSLEGVDKTNAPSSATGPSSLWCLADKEVERRQWDRLNEDEEDDDEEHDPLESDLQDLSDYEDAEDLEKEEADGEKRKRRRSDQEDWDVESNIGRDRTLDYEEEEDECDKVAVGAVQTGDRLYMKDVKFSDYGIDELNTYAELPTSFHEVSRDPRANHIAAKIRLQEDAKASGSFDTSEHSDNLAMSIETEDVKRRGLNIDNPKSILKKRETSTDSRSQKRVRFLCDPESHSRRAEQQVSETNNLASESSIHNTAVEQPVSDPSQYSSGIPDYIRNPSKYTCYTFDSSEDEDEQSNKKAYMDLLWYLRERNSGDSSLDDTTSVHVTKPVMFTRKTTAEDASVAKSDSGPNTGDDPKKRSWFIGLAAEDIQESEVSAMEDDDPSVCVDGGFRSQKPGRKYRPRITTNEDGMS